MDCFGTFFTHFTYVPQPDWRCCCSSRCCCAVLTHARFLGWGGGVGWGAMTCTVLAHIFDATQLYLRTCSMLRNYYLRTCWMKCYQCSHQKKIFAIDMKRKPRGLSKKKGTQTIDRAWLSLKRFLPKEANKKKGKGMLAEVRDFLEERVKQWTMACWTLACEPAFVQAAVSSNT